MYTQSMTADLAATHIALLRAETLHRHLVAEVRRSSRTKQDQTFGTRPRRQRFWRLATA
jgi:hypothetical protein